MRFLFLFFSILYFLQADLYAEQKVSISGIIKDRNDNPIPLALISIEGTTNGTYSDDEGYYSLELHQGNYTMVISAFGFQKHKELIHIKTDERQNFILEEEAVLLSAVEIQGKTKSERLREGSFTINSLDIKDQINSLNNLNSIVGRSSGIQIRENGGVGADFDLSINGLSGNSIRYFIDGIPLSSIGNGVSLSNLPINIIDRVEIYKGVVPIDLGSDALGGAINIITKKNVKKYLDISYGIGSFNTYKGDFNAQFIDSKTGIFIRPTFGINYSKNNYMMKGVEVWNSSTSEFEKIDVKRFHDDYFSVFGQLNIGVNNKRWTDLFSVSGTLSSIDNELQMGTVQNIVYGMAKRKNESYTVSSQYQKRNILINDLSINIAMSYTWDNVTVVDTAYRKYSWNGSSIESSRNEITGRGKSIRHIRRPLTIGRANFNYMLNDNNSFNFNYLINYILNKRTDDVDLDFEPSKDSFTKQILGLSYTQNFWQDKWTNTFFVKEYLSHLNIEQQDLSWITGSKNTKGSSSTSNGGYGFSSRFRFSELFAIKTSFEHSIRLPLTNEYLGNGTTVYPNFNLNPENSNNINFGLFGSYQIASEHLLSYELGLYHRKVKDYIRLVITEADGMSQYANVNNVTVNGIEGEVRYLFNNLFQAIVNISCLDEKNKTKYQVNGKPEITYNNRMPNRPWFYSNLELNFRFKDVFGLKDSQLRLAYYLHYVHWFYLTWEGYGNLSSKSTIPTQYLNNLQLTYSLKKEKYNVSLECNNIFDRIVYDNYMMQKPGRAFFCKFRLFFN